MNAKVSFGYRERIYAGYVTRRGTPLAPQTVTGLAPRMPYLRKLIKRCLPTEKNAKILELGCGHGALLYALHAMGYEHARGVDGSVEQVASARRLGIEGVTKEDILEKLQETPHASLDVVITFDVIEHFTKNELIPLIDEVSRVLRAGGRWIIHVPNAESPFGALMRYGDFTHEVAFTRVSLDQLLRASGFAQVHCYEDRPVPHGFRSTVRALLWLAIRATLLTYMAVETGAVDRDAIFSQNLLAVAYTAR